MDTSWENVSEWYTRLLSKNNTYQKQVILPNVLRLAELKKGEKVLDLACGGGFFTAEFFKSGAEIYGIDASSQLIEFALKNSPQQIKYFVSEAEKTPFPDSKFEKIAVILALQNIKKMNDVLAECSRILKKKGALIIVLNHPVLRIPKYSQWGWDVKQGIQYRRIDRYLSEMEKKIDMTPGGLDKVYTYSFHRPLQSYFKSLEKNGFAVIRLEEWISNKKSEKGPRQKAEDESRREFPLFLAIKAIRL